jgi:hypothetical protein
MHMITVLAMFMVMVIVMLVVVLFGDRDHGRDGHCLLRLKVAALTGRPISEQILKRALFVPVMAAC